MQVTTEDLKQAIETKQLPKLLFLVYDEGFLATHWLLKLTDALIDPSVRTLDLQVFRGEDASKLELSKLRAAVETPAFISPVKLIVVEDSKFFQPGARGVKGPAFQDEAKDQWQSFLTQLPRGQMLVFKESKLDKRQKKFWQALEEQGAWFCTIPKAKEQELLAWISALAGRRNIQVAKDAAYELLERTGDDMTTVQSELMKILDALSQRQKTKLTREDVEELARPNLQGDVFKLLDAMAEGKVAKAFVLKKRLLERREPLPLIQFMMARKVRQLMVAKDLNDKGAIARRLKVPPFVAKKLMDEARNFDARVLERHYRELFLSDWAMKSGRLTDDLAFDLTLFTTAGKAPSKEGLSFS